MSEEKFYAPYEVYVGGAFEVECEGLKAAKECAEDAAAPGEEVTILKKEVVETGVVEKKVNWSRA